MEPIKNGKALRHVCAWVPMTGSKGKSHVLRQKSGTSQEPAPGLPSPMLSAASLPVLVESITEEGRPSADVFDGKTKGWIAGWKQALWCDIKASYMFTQFIVACRGTQQHTIHLSKYLACIRREQRKAAPPGGCLVALHWPKGVLQIPSHGICSSTRKFQLSVHRH